MVSGRLLSGLLQPFCAPRAPIGNAIRSQWTHSTPVLRSNFSSSRSIISQINVSRRQPFHSTPRRPRDPADDPNWKSLIDEPPQLVRVKSKHGPGIILLAIIPITAFLLGTWQVHRLRWKTDLIAKAEDRIIRPPLPLPPHVDPDAVADFDFRRVTVTGRFRHDKEMLVGPRMRDGEQGYMVVTPLERNDDPTATVLVHRGWISKKMADQRLRDPEALPQGEVTIEGMLRTPWKKNFFTPENRPDRWEFYFPDVKQMAELTGSQAVWIEQTMDPDFFTLNAYQEKGVPIGRPAEVNLRNNHAQYIITWYGLSLATAIMFWMVLKSKKSPNEAARRVRMNMHW